MPHGDILQWGLSYITHVNDPAHISQVMGTQLLVLMSQADNDNLLFKKYSGGWRRGQLILTGGTGDVMGKSNSRALKNRKMLTGEGHAMV